MSRSWNGNDGRLPWGRRFMMPQERKEYGPKADFATPTLQFWGGAVPIRLLVGLLAASWFVFMPPLFPWGLGMILAVLGPPALWWIGTGWLLKWMGATLERGFVAHLGTTIVVVIMSALLAYHQVWDWWEGICYSGFFGVPTLHIEGGTVFILIGMVMGLCGVAFMLWKPSRYTFGLQVTGWLLTIVSWRLFPPKLYVTRGATDTLSKYDLMFYGVWATITLAVYFSSRPYLKRMDTEMADDYPLQEQAGGQPEQQTPVQYPRTRYFGVERSQAHRGLESPGRIIEVTGPKGQDWVLSTTNLIYFINQLPIKGIKLSDWKGERMPAGLAMIDKRNGDDIIFKDAPITQHYHWGPYYHFLMEYDIYDGKKFAPQMRGPHGQPNPDSIKAALGLVVGGAWWEEELTEEEVTA